MALVPADLAAVPVVEDVVVELVTLLNVAEVVHGRLPPLTLELETTVTLTLPALELAMTAV